MQERVLLSDEVLYAILHLSARENLLDGDTKTVEFYKNLDIDLALGHRSLALIPIFEELLLPEMYDELAPRLPYLEGEGIAVRIPDTLSSVERLNKSGWGLNRDFDYLARVLRELDVFRGLIVDRIIDTEDRLMSEESRFWPRVQNRIPLKREQFYDALIRYAAALLNDDYEELRSNALVFALEPWQLQAYQKEIVLRNRPFTEQSIVDFVLLQAIVQYDQILLASTCTRKYEASVATKAFARAGTPISESAMKFAETFCLMRVALFQSDACFPQIESIRHAVRLRRDPNMKAFRKQLIAYQNSISEGNFVDAMDIRRDVTTAYSTLERLQSSKTALDWITYAAFPVGVLTSLAAGDFAQLANLGGLGLSLIGAAGTHCTNKEVQENSWVLVGR